MAIQFLAEKKGGFPAQVRAPKVRIPVGGFGVAIPPKNHVQLKNHITIQKQHQWVIKLKNKHSRRECQRRRCESPVGRSGGDISPKNLVQTKNHIKIQKPHQCAGGTGVIRRIHKWHTYFNTIIVNKQTATFWNKIIYLAN